MQFMDVCALEQARVLVGVPT
ncbi:hypothetical protein CO2235_MP80340 [Cupriavidus oxalaticus]|uniref:Uncharacterized protein n=1 Tax=Cupriavidus oxalaticus TaxID=96344 RepID=A0A375GQ27_9BURK|nr:hypothetical protein CO2235_U770151 [Cupriavidus oxalaticus]SPC24460.1 hypothetical protein CO2235_MP80340 [Cupriavidus oxalaticus]